MDILLFSTKFPIMITAVLERFRKIYHTRDIPLSYWLVQEGICSCFQLFFAWELHSFQVFFRIGKQIGITEDQIRAVCRIVNDLPPEFGDEIHFGSTNMRAGMAWCKQIPFVSHWPHFQSIIAFLLVCVLLKYLLNRFLKNANSKQLRDLHWRLISKWNKLKLYNQTKIS